MIRLGNLVVKGSLLLLTTALAVVPIWLENSSDLSELFSRGKLSCTLRESETPAIFDTASLYKRMLRWHGHRPATDRVILVQLDTDQPALHGDLCATRAYTADLLKVLSTMQPGVVALDRLYSDKACAPDDANTRALQAGVHAFPDPLVVSRPDQPAQTDDHFACTYVAPSLPFQSPHLTHAILRLHEEPLHIPLRWQVRTEDRVGAPYVPLAESYGLAYATALQLEPGLDAGLDAMARYEPVEDPFADIVDSPDPQEIKASDLLCAAGGEAMKRRWGLPCTEPAALPSLRHKAVLIGEQNEADHPATLGEETLFGYQLQGRYLAALLGGAYLREWVLGWQVIFAVLLALLTEALGLIFGLRELLPVAWSRPLHRRITVIAFITGLCVAALLIGLGSLLFGYLPPLGWLASVVVLLISSWRSFLLEGVVARRFRRGEDA